MHIDSDPFPNPYTLANLEWREDRRAVPIEDEAQPGLLSGLKVLRAPRCCFAPVLLRRLPTWSPR